MCLVATSWLEYIGNHVYTTKLREDIQEFQLTMTLFLSSLQYPRAADFAMSRTTKEEHWERLKSEYDALRITVDNMRMLPNPKRLRRTSSGDESPIVSSSQTTGSSSQGAPTSAPPPVSVQAEDADADTQLAPHQCGGG